MDDDGVEEHPYTNQLNGSNSVTLDSTTRSAL